MVRNAWRYCDLSLILAPVSGKRTACCRGLGQAVSMVELCGKVYL